MRNLFLAASLLALTAGALLVYPIEAPPSVALEGPATPTAVAFHPEESTSPAPVESTSTPEDWIETQETAIPETPEPQPIENQAALVSASQNAPILYYAQSGDSLDVLALRFGVSVTDITSPDLLPDGGFLPEGQLLLIPSTLTDVSLNLRLFPDLEVINSPSAINFDLTGFIQQAGGKLATYYEGVRGHGYLTGSEIVQVVAQEFSIHPRLLLALLEYQSGWVYGYPATYNQEEYPMGFVRSGQDSLYKQLILAAGALGTGYYGWREGTLLALNFPDGTRLRLAPELNCGTVAWMYFFSRIKNFDTWNDALYSANSLLATYEAMFGNPWLIAQQYAALNIPPQEQPELALPFEPGVIWSFTSGPHAAWGAVEVRAALDFAPPMDTPGCGPTYAWVLASSPGMVVRSINGAVVVDMDGDGDERTGWNILYMHIATEGRVPVGTWVETGDRIGYPSCEGGRSTGTHTHIARKYNGEWIPADGPLAFNLGGWIAKADSQTYMGWLVKGDQVVKSSLVGATASHIWQGK
jgi:murein DD-endopeptidase MepM/ murein hydrolase activator NlpD